MARIIKAYFTATNDPDFVPCYEEVIMLTQEISLQIYESEREWVFRTFKRPGASEIDLSTCKRVSIGFMDYDINVNLPTEFLASASFMDVIRMLMEGKYK